MDRAARRRDPTPPPSLHNYATDTGESEYNTKEEVNQDNLTGLMVAVKDMGEHMVALERIRQELKWMKKSLDTDNCARQKEVAQ